MSSATKEETLTQPQNAAALPVESDRRAVQAALLLGASVAALPGAAGALWKYRWSGRLAAFWNAVKNYRPHPALFLAVAVALFAAVSFAQSHTVATQVRVNGQVVGQVADRSVYTAARDFVQSAASDALGYEYDFEGQTLSAFPVVVKNGTLMSEDQLADKICRAGDIVTYTYVLEVDGETIGTAASQSRIEALLKQKLNQYRTENTISAEFTQNIQIGRQIISDEEKDAMAPLNEAINGTSQAELIYTVVAGDTWSEIADRYEMSSADLLALNPECNMELIQIGQELTVSAAVPVLSVKTVDHVTYETPVAFETEQIDDSSLYVGESRVVTAGVNGVAQVEANVSAVDGTEMSRDIVSSVTVTEPVTQVVAVGTKERPKTMATGRFIWPASGRLSSTYGYRTVLGVYRMHKGIDIAGSYGRAISASDGGTVTYAGWMSGYGYLVIIDHGNGYETYYGHNSSLLVSVGDKVYQGQQIAKMGSTGRSTGNHCHFEVRYNGATMNPLNYLS